MTQSNEGPSYRIQGKGSFVRISYSVRAGKGPILKGADKPEILEFVTGYMQVVPGLEKRLAGHGLGEKLSFTVQPSEAFGERRADFLIEKPKSDFFFPLGVEPYPGMEIPLVAPGDNAPDTVIIKEVKEEAIIIDFNHPLAGVPLEYVLEIAEARAAKPDDVCGEWDSPSDPESCCATAPYVILGAKETEH
jgi:FKBP-type peptidyl-prolyl cis-trans isomerase SlyD